MIKIYLLGQLVVRSDKGHSANLQTRRGMELFAFLVLEADRLFTRSRLAEQFWGHLSESRGRKALNTEVWRLQNALRSVGMDVDAAFHRSTQEIGYRRQSNHWVDVDTLAAAQQVLDSVKPEEADAQQLKKVETAISTYRGDLLESVYSDWCFIWRESVRAQYTEALEFVLRSCMARKDWNAALRSGRKLLTADPLMEHIHRAVMRCHFHNGNRPLALRQFALCEQYLREELDVEPMEETRRVQETILSVEPRSPAVVKRRASTPVAKVNAHERSSAQKVDLALANINTARNWLEDVSRDLRVDNKPAT